MRSLIILTCLFFVAATMLGATEQITVLGPGGQVDVIAKIDTGADSTSIDHDLAEQLGLQAIPGRTRIVEAVAGTEERPVAELTFVLADQVITTDVTISDREGRSTPVLIGRADLQGFVVDPNHEQLTVPTADIPGLWQRVLANETVKLLLLLPTLAGLIIILRILLGLQTYGVFGPLIIALSLIQAGIGLGMLIYGVMLLGGIIFILLIKRLKYPLLCEIALLMFFLAGISVLVNSLSATVLAAALFPLVITSFLIERFSQHLEVHETRHALVLLTTTLLAAILLAFLGSAILDVGPTGTLGWLVASLAGTIGLAHYVGLRLTEVFRFKFLGEQR